MIKSCSLSVYQVYSLGGVVSLTVLEPGAPVDGVVFETDVVVPGDQHA